MKHGGTPDLDLVQLDSKEESNVQYRFHDATTSTEQLKNISQKLLQCQHCDYTTVRSSDLKRHSRKHSGDMLQC